MSAVLRFHSSPPVPSGKGVQVIIPSSEAPPDSRLAVDPRRFRQVLGQYPTGVCAITATHTAHGPVGMIVGSFTSVSLEPPLVGFFPDRGSTSWPKIRETGRFCVNVLAHDQESVCRQLGSKSPDKFDGLAHRPGPSGSPIIAGAAAWIDCHISAIAEAGDHYFVLGAVEDLHTDSAAIPLVFFAGGYRRLSAGPTSAG